MKTKVGLWIDHREAIIVSLHDQEEGIKRITSEAEENAQQSASQDDSGEDKRYKQDRRFDNDLNKYYDEVISYLRNADTILIFGPGVAKSELQKRFDDQTQDGRVIEVETTDNMTESQIVAKVRDHFQG
jgi:stalled ribosome rescue protein Dom34